MSAIELFNPDDDFDTVAHDLKSTVADIALHVLCDSRFQSLHAARKIECFASGILAGLMGSIFSMCADTTEAHDELERFVTDHVKQARAQAEDIAANGETRQ